MNITNTIVNEKTDSTKLSSNSVNNTEPAHEPIVTIHKKYLSSHLLKISIEISPLVTIALQQLAITLFKSRALEGFFKNEIPNEYIEENFKQEILTKIKSFLLKHLVIKNLMNTIQNEKIPVANYPRLSRIDFEKENTFSYSFDLSIADPIELKEWKNFSFKSPKRKKYKDLDKQVINYLENEIAEAKKYNNTIAEENDWVFFETLLVDKDNVPLTPYLKDTFWVKLKNEEVIDPLHALFIGKKVNESFVSDYLEIDGTNNEYENYRYPYLIKINALVKGKNLSLDLLRNTFKLKNKTEVHNKLMEVFSYRNDLSQRKAIIEEIFHLLLSKHRFEVPKHLVLRRQEDILASLCKQPDYQVYKAQKNFDSYVEMLAEKQLKEEILIDQITHHENLCVEITDMQNYLHLFNNKRLREFVYFKPLLEKLDTPNTPISTTSLNLSVLREKTLNHIIHTLTH